MGSGFVLWKCPMHGTIGMLAALMKSNISLASHDQNLMKTNQRFADVKARGQ